MAKNPYATYIHAIGTMLGEAVQADPSIMRTPEMLAYLKATRALEVMAKQRIPGFAHTPATKEYQHASFDVIAETMMEKGE